MQLKIRSLLLALTCSFLFSAGQAQSLPSSGEISSGSTHAVAVRFDGRVFSWGNNANGRLGIGNTTQKLIPTLISGITNVSSTSAGGNHTVAVKTDGTVWAWGLNTNGQLGDNTTTQRTSPVQITAINGVISVAAGPAHTLALKQNGTVWAWGLNSDGRLGDNSTSQRLAPVQVSGITGVIAIAAGSTYSLALKSDGTVWAWGDNTNGRLGDGTTTQCLIPVQVSTITQVAAVAAGSSFGLALKTDGTVWAWGDNVNGMLGDGTTTQRLTPVQVNALSAITAISAGDSHALALKNDGAVYAWGNNTSGKLGDGTLINQLSPVTLSGLSNISKIRAGTDYNLAISADGRVLSWGGNSSGQLGSGATLPRKTPTQVYTVYPITKMAARSGVAGAIQAGGKLYVWGRNSNGQLGNGTQSSSRLPLIHPTIGTLIDVSFGATHALAVKNDGTVWAWGDNTNGRLGDGTTVAKLSPTQVSGLSGITRVAAGGTHSLALKSDGTVWAWGDNTNGRLGDNSTTQRLLPVQVSGLSGVVAIGAGDAHSVALKSDGTVRAWGLNTNGRIGDGSTTQRLLPVQVTGLTSATSISIGGSHNLARKSDGSVWVWGNNANGRLGDGTTTQKTTAVQLVGFLNVTRVSAGSAHSLAVKSDGTVWAWGLNNSGQLGDSSVTTRTSPVQVPGITDISDIAAGEDNSFALTSKATVWGWGMNALGSLGINEPIFSQAAGIRLISSGSDTDGDGLADAWEMSHFGNLTATGAVDTDNDGLTDAQEFMLSTSPVAADQDQDFLGDIADPDPANFFNGAPPSLVALSGGGQVAPPLSVNLQPFEVAIWNSDASYPLINAPLTFSVTSGGGLLSVNASPETSRSSILQLRADSDGTGRAYYQQPSGDGVSSQVTVASGGATVNFATSSSASPDSDFDGLSDAQEVLLGTNSQVGDTDNDGIPDALEVRLGLNPVVADVDQVPAAIGGRRLHLRGDLGVTASSSYVTTWADQSGKGNNAIVADTAYRPRQFTNVVNGKPVIRFDGTDDYLQLANAMSGAAMAEMFIVSKTTIRSGNDESIIYLSSAGATSLPGSNGWLSDGFGSSSFRESGVTTARLTAFNLYNVSAKAGEWKSAINGLPLAYTRYNQVAFMNAPTIGLGGGYFKGDIAEIVVFDHVLTELERGAMTLYLSNRYALGSSAAAPTNLLATSISSSQISLRWSAVIPSTSAFTYIVERRLGTGDYLVVGEVANSLSYVDSGLTPGASYEYRVRARGLNGVSSAYSNTSAVTTVEGEQALPMEDLGLWLRADAGITDSGAIATWADQSSGKNDANAIDPATKPTLVANVVNGKPVLRFDGTADMLQLPSDTMTGATAGEVFLVSRTSTRVGYSEPALTMGLGGATVLPDSDAIARDGFGSTQQHDLVVNSATFASFNIYNAMSLSGLWQAWCNGSLAGSSTANVVNFGGSLTVASDGMNYFKGDIAELLVFKRTLTGAERSAVTRYLGAKFALGANASAPTASTANAISSSQVNVEWLAAAPGASAVWYSLERSTEAGTFTVISEATNVFSYVDTGLAGGASYSYRVRARGLNGVHSAYSPIASITLPVSGEPLPLNGMRTWLKADAGVDGGALWLDQSGNSNHASADYITSKPAKIGNAVNGRPALRFDGTDDALSLPGSLMSGANQGEFFIVFNKTNRTGYGEPVISLGGVSSTYLPDFDGLLRDDFGSATPHEVEIPQNVFQSFHVYNARSRSNEWASSIDGTTILQETANQVSFAAQSFIGSDGSNYFKGDIAEIIVYDHVLTDVQRSTVNSYLLNKYGISVGPRVPANLDAAGVSPSHINLTWEGQLPGAPVALYSLERKSGDGTFEIISETYDVSYSDEGLSSNTEYTYRVRAKIGSGPFTAYSNIAVATTVPLPPPPAPSAIMVHLQSEDTVLISWQFADQALPTTFLLERAVENGEFSIVGDSLTERSFVDSGVTANTTYVYRVKAVNQQGESNYTTSSPIFVLPASSQLSLLPEGAGGVRISWQDQGLAESAIYVLERQTANGFVTIATLTDGFSFVDQESTFEGGPTYRLTVKALNGTVLYQSAIVTAQTPPADPSLVITAEQVDGYHVELTLAWPNQSTPDLLVQRKVGTGGFVTLQKTPFLHWNDPDVFASGTSLQYRVWRVLNGLPQGSSEICNITIEQRAPVAFPSASTVLVYPNSQRSAPLVFDTSTQPGMEKTITISTGPAHGSVAQDQNGVWKYTAAAGFTGEDSFQFSVNDGVVSAPTKYYINVEAVAAPSGSPGDVDGDGVPDAVEQAKSMDQYDPRDGSVDDDADGLATSLEIQIGTNPASQDTDGDGYVDGTEYAYGTNPLSELSFPSKNYGQVTSPNSHDEPLYEPSGEMMYNEGPWRFERYIGWAPTHEWHGFQRCIPLMPYNLYTGEDFPYLHIYKEAQRLKPYPYHVDPYYIVDHAVPYGLSSDTGWSLFYDDQGRTLYYESSYGKVLAKGAAMGGRRARGRLARVWGIKGTAYPFYPAYDGLSHGDGLWYWSSAGGAGTIPMSDQVGRITVLSANEVGDVVWKPEAGGRLFVSRRKASGYETIELTGLIGTPGSITESGRIGSLVPIPTLILTSFKETANKANQVFNPTPKDDPWGGDGYGGAGSEQNGAPRNMLFLVPDPQDNKYKVTIGIQIASTGSPKFIAAAYVGETKVANSDSEFNFEGKCDLAFEHLGTSNNIEDYRIRVGYDSNGSGTLDPEEISKLAVETFGEPTVRGTRGTRYDAAKQNIDNIVDGDWTSPGWATNLVLPHAKRFLQLFRDGNIDSIPEDKKPTASSLVSFDAFNGYFSEWLTHNSGAPFSESGVANITEYTWGPLTSTADLIASSPQIEDSVEALYVASIRSLADSYFASLPLGSSTYFPSSTGFYDVPHAHSPAWVPATTVTFDSWLPNQGDDVNGTMGRGRLLSHKVRYRVEKKLVSYVAPNGSTFYFEQPVVTEVISQGAVVDLYDFTHLVEGAGQDAAILQIGFGNGSYSSNRDRGKIYRNRIEFQKIYTTLP